MHEKPVKEIIGKRVVGQHGREIGVVSGVLVDTESWRVTSLRIKPDKGALEELHLKRSLVRGPTVRLPIDQVSGITDMLVLKVPLEELKLEQAVAGEAERDPAQEEGPAPDSAS